MVYEFQCHNAECSEYQVTKDSYVPRFESPAPDCPQCETQMVRVMETPPRLSWLGSVGRFGDKNKEYYDESGFWAYRVKTSRHPDGRPERVRIETRQQMKEFAKAEGLMLPDEMNPNAEISKDGRSFSTRGVRNQWV